MRYANSLVSLVLTIVATACGSKDTTGRTREALETCSAGTWLTADRTCSCRATLPTNTSECAADDCTEADVLVLMANGTSYDLIVRKSGIRNTLSAAGGAGGVAPGTWQVTGDLQLVQDFGTRTYSTSVTCNAATLVRPSKVTYTRAPAELATALDRASLAKWATVNLR